MKTVLTKDLLQSRRKEVFGYLRFLEKALETSASLHTPGSAPIPLETDLTHTLKANAYLLLYNTVEAVMSQLMIEIHDEVKSSDVCLDELNPNLYLEVIRSLKSGNEDIAETFAHPSGRPFVDYWLRDYEKRVHGNRNPHFSGNIDGKRIKTIGRIYGFASGDDATDAKFTHAALQKAKDHRNKLAHGEMSFKDLGRWISFPQVREDAIATLRTLSNVRAAVESYLVTHGYRRNNSPVLQLPKNNGSIIQTDSFASAA